MIVFRRAAAAGAMIAAALLAGCKPEPATPRTAKPTDVPSAGPLELKPPAKPGQSSPEGQAKLAALLAAHTGGKPARLDALKSAGFTRVGVLFLNGPPGFPATQTVEVAWPARFKSSTEITTETVGTTAVGLSPEGNWISQSNRPHGDTGAKALPKQKIVDDLLLTAQRQMQEDHCFLLFPFADPVTKVLIADDAKIGQERDCYGLHVWTPALEYALLHVDKKSNLLVRLSFAGHENGRDVLKELLFEDAQDFGGVKLPAKVYIRAAGIELAEWRSLKVTAGKTFDPKHFDNP